MSSLPLLRASQTRRWVQCPSSVYLGHQADKAVNVEYDETYALEGTHAHRLVELELSRMLDPNVDMNKYQERLTEIQTDSLYDSEMLEHAEVMLDEVRLVLNDAQAKQQHLNFSIEGTMQAIVNGVKVQGTADFIAETEDGNNLYVLDYKYGMGIEVSAVDNYQLLMYALLKSFETGKAYKNIQLVVVQPRISNISRAKYNQDDLMNFKFKVVDAIDRILDRTPAPKVGDWCKWCSAKPRCRAHKEKLDDLDTLGLLPSLLDDNEILKALRDADYIVDWLNDLKAYAHSKAMSGHYWPGFKLVESRRRRTITDAEAVAATLISAGYDTNEVFDTKLKPITRLEKSIGREMFKDLVDPYIELSALKYNLVDSADKRPAASLNKPGDEF